MKYMHAMLLVLFFAGCHYSKSPEMRLCTRLDWQSVLDMFPKNSQQIIAAKNKAIGLMDEMLASIESLSGKYHNFHNTVRVYDNAKFKFIMNMQMLSSICMLSADDNLRLTANQAVCELQQYQADTLIRNKMLLAAFQDYAQNGKDDQSKTISIRTFLQTSINRLEHEGANLAPEILVKLSQLSQEINHLEGQFNYNIVHHSGSIICTKNELIGVPALFIDSLVVVQNEYTVPLTYEAFFAVLENCCDQATRKKMFIAFHQRVQKKNELILKNLMHKRNEYARLVGYENFAEYECSLQMIGSVARAKDFIGDMVEQTNKIVDQEFKKLTQELPASVELSASGKLQPWDEAFVKSAYRKKHFDIDAAQVAHYFPINHVIDQIQKQFGQFFGLSFDPVSSDGLWYKDLICLRVRLLKTNQIIGYLVFDLYARPGKSEQASQMAIIPAIQDDCNLVCSGLSTIVTNFTQAGFGCQTLLDFHDVKILLHEFGHALQELFGATEFVDIAGSKGPKDFIEVPSQLFEMWMDDPMMIKRFSQHDITKKQLSDEMVAQIVAAEKFGRASLLQRQCLLSLISLEFGCMHDKNDSHAIVEKLYKQVRNDVEYCSQDYFETAFEHLINYGSSYYGYVWSQVLAAGLFEYITKHGITNSSVGQKLYESLLAHGGSQDPRTLIDLSVGSSVTKQSLLDSLKS